MFIHINKIIWSKADWIDFYRTIKSFKKRLIKRHKKGDDMQETQYYDEEGAKKLKEFFSGKTVKDVTGKMDDRLEELTEQGHTLIRRVKIGRNDICPCGSGIKFKKCCINKLK